VNKEAVVLENSQTLEGALSEIERRTGVAAASAKKYLNAVLSAKKASAHGDLAGMKKALSDARETLQLARAEFESAATAWPFDDAGELEHFESGAFGRELIAAAESLGLTVTEEEGQFMCYPSVVRLDPARRVVTIDKKPHRFVRPSVLAAHLRAQQTRSVRFRPGPFLEALFAAWNYARHADTKGRGPAVDVSVDRIYAVLTVAPGSKKEYSRQEFGRDLFLLEGSEDVKTKSGAEVHFSRSTGAKAGRGITIVKENGERVVYSSVSFREPRHDA